MSSSVLLRQSRLLGSTASRTSIGPLVFASRFHVAPPSRVSDKDPYKYVPGGPVLPGTVNDATTFPPPNKSHGSHHWAFERLLSVALIPLTASTFAMSSSPHPVIDGILAVSLVIHSHIGFDSMLVDYVHERKFPILGKVGTWGLRALTGTVLVGIYQFNTTDVGLTELIMRVWQA